MQAIDGAPEVRSVALMADDFPGLKPRMAVEVGDQVRRGQLVFEDRNIPGVRHTAPGAGRVEAVNRGARRALQSVVIALSDAERGGRAGAEDFQAFSHYTVGDPDGLSVDAVRDLLVESGLWAAFRTRPFSKVPAPNSQADAIFVTATDSHPLAPLPEVVLRERRHDFEAGLRLVVRLTAGPTHLCVRPGSEIERGITAPVTVHSFDGPHPAGTAGLHIHLVAPVSRSRTVWWIGYQDVVAVGELFRTGVLPVDRVVSLAGPPVPKPRLIRTRVGASTADIVKHEGIEGDVRTISGSVLSGKAAIEEPFAYMGRYDRQVSVVAEGREREFLGWLAPGWKVFSTIPAFVSALSRKRRFAFTTSTLGSARAMVPIGVYERVVPFDVLATYLLRALVVGDLEQAERLGCLEFDEEDLSLCTFVCPGKTDYGPILRRNLEQIAREG